MPNRTQTELLHDLENGSLREKQEALRHLSAVGEAEALDAVIEHLRSTPESTSKTALNTLSILAHKYYPSDRYSLAEVLLPFLASETWQQRLTATRLFNTYPNEMAIDPLSDTVYEARERVYQERSNQQSQIRIMAERVLAEGVVALANCGKLSALPDILDMVEDRYLRPLATRALGIIGSDTERPHLEDLAEDEDPRVRDAAQWALGLMDNRVEALINPPEQQQEPPPDRLHPLYWAHRQLDASADDLIQFLVVRVGIEHLILDHFISEGRIPDKCTITLREHQGDMPPRYVSDQGEVIASWKYTWQGPQLEISEEEPLPPPRPNMLPTKRKRQSHLSISYPRSLLWGESGLVSFDCQFNSAFSKGWIYQISLQDGDWWFTRIRRTWSS